jgi:hypothetical protein
MDAFKLFPSDVFWSYVLPKCTIDARRAFGLQPGRLDMAPYETGALGDAFRRRYRDEHSYGNSQVASVTVPLWGVDLTLQPNSWFEEYGHVTGCPVNLTIRREFDSNMSRKIPGGYLISVRINDRRYPLLESNCDLRIQRCGLFGITAEGKMTRYEPITRAEQKSDPTFISRPYYSNKGLIVC